MRRIAVLSLLLCSLLALPVRAHSDIDPSVDEFRITAVLSEAVSLDVERGSLRLDRESLIATVGCNAVSMYANVQPGGRVSHGLIRSTEMACPEGLDRVEAAMLRVLGGHDLRLTADALESDAGALLLEPLALCTECAWRDEEGVLRANAADGAGLVLLLVPLAAGLFLLAISFSTQNQEPAVARRSPKGRRGSR